MEKIEFITYLENEPLTLGEVKPWLKGFPGDQDNSVQSLIVAAREYAEQYTGIRIRRCKMRQYFDAGLPVGVELESKLAGFNMSGILFYEYLKSIGSYQVLLNLNNADYELDTRSSTPIVFCLNRAMEDSKKYNTMCIECSVGWAPAEVPEDIKTAIRLMVAYWFENREDGEIIMSSHTKLPRVRAAQVLLNKYKFS